VRAARYCGRSHYLALIVDVKRDASNAQCRRVVCSAQIAEVGDRAVFPEHGVSGCRRPRERRCGASAGHPNSLAEIVDGERKAHRVSGRQRQLPDLAWPRSPNYWFIIQNEWSDAVGRRSRGALRIANVGLSDSCCFACIVDAAPVGVGASQSRECGHDANSHSRGDTIYYNGSAWTNLAGNNSGTNCLSKTSSGVPSWATCGSGGSTTWNSIGTATGNATISLGAYTTTFNQTSNQVWSWNNTTTATALTTNASPNIWLTANHWTGFEHADPGVARISDCEQHGDLLIDLDV